MRLSFMQIKKIIYLKLKKNQEKLINRRKLIHGNKFKKAKKMRMIKEGSR